jgi:probable rRNA maturation factor
LSFPELDATTVKARDLAIFPSSMPVPLGDVVLAFETIVKEAKTQKKSLEAHAMHLVAHGVLHLLGYDHMIDKPATRMEKLECDILAILGYPNPSDES